MVNTLSLDLWINDEYFEKFLGSGICLCSQIGSTAINRSLGGSVIQHGLPLLQLSEIMGIHHWKHRSLRSSLILKEDAIIHVTPGTFKNAMLCYDHKKTSEFILPVLFILTCAFMKFGRENFAVYQWFYIPLVRCVQYMSEGVILYRVFKSKAFEAVRNGSLFFNLVGIMSIASVFAMERYKNIHIMLFAFIVLYTSCPESWINKVVKGRIFHRIGDASYAVYLNHAVVIMAMEDIFAYCGIVMEHTQFAWLAAGVSLVYSIFTMLLLDKLTPWFNQKFIPALKSKKII